MADPFLGFDELEPAQSQPEIVVNAADRTLSAAINIEVLDKDLTTPPASPASTARYIVPPVGATGAWAPFANKIVYLQGTTWKALTPRNGWIVKVVDENKRYEWNSTAWVEFVAGGSIAISGPDESPPVNVSDVSSIEFVNAIVENLGGGAVRITALGNDALPVVDLGMFFPGTPASNQLMFKFVAARAMEFPANFAGSVGHIGTNPTASFAMVVSVAGSNVGTITVNTSGVFSFATSGGVAIPVDPGERIEIAAPAGVDATAADIAATLLADVL